MEYAILAAGQGSRFVKEGERSPKPMVDILGRPMIERLIEVLMECDAERIHIATNSAMPVLTEFLENLKEAKHLPLVVKPIVSDNSYYSLVQAASGIEGRFIAMTCDAIFPTAEFKEYVRRCAEAPEDVMVMGLTEYIEDESPLYAKLTPDGSEIVNYRYGGEPFEGTPIVSAGLYGITDKALRKAAEKKYPESLSDFQRILAVEDHYKVEPYVMSIAFDVDCTRDRLHAEQFVMDVNGERRR